MSAAKRVAVQERGKTVFAVYAVQSGEDTMGGFYHQVAQGEWLTKIAAKYKISNWRKTIWQHPNNAEFAKSRDPNLLYPRDRIFIPDPNPKTVDRGTDAKHQFVVKKDWDEFFLKLLDAKGTPLAGETYRLDVGKRVYEGTTDGNGEIHIEQMDPSAEDGSLVLPDRCIVLRVQMGQLNPGHDSGASDIPQYDDGVSGMQMRLINLGYNPGKADGIFGPRTQAAVMEFQIFDMELEPDKATGKLDGDTKQAIVAKHGS